MHYAALAGNIHTTKILVENGLDVNENISGYDLPLSYAVQGGSLEVVKFLVEHGAFIISPEDKQKNAVMKAAGYGHVEIFNYLIEVLQEEMDWEECLRMAIGGGNPAIVTYLVEKKKVDINKPYYTNMYFIQTAAESFRPTAPVILEYLLSKGVRLEDINNGELFPWAFRKCREETLLCILNHIETPPIQCSGGGETWCGLAEALDKNWFKLAEWFLHFETDYTFRGKPLLIYFADELEDSAQILAFLIGHGINTAYLSEALLHAAAHDNIEAIETLLTAGADINFEQNGENALCLANDRMTVELHIDRGIDTRNPKLQENLWRKPDVCMELIWKKAKIKFTQEMLDKGLNYAARSCHHNAIRYYISKKADPNYFHPTCIPPRLMTETDKSVGMTALMVYVTFKPSSEEIIQELVKAGAEVNLANEEGMTALHYAAMPNLESSFQATEGIGSRQDRENGAHAHTIFPYKSYDAFFKSQAETKLRPLLRAGAKVNAVDKEGKTPLQRAIETNNTYAIELLKRAGGKVKIKKSQLSLRVPG